MEINASSQRNRHKTRKPSTVGRVVVSIFGIPFAVGGIFMFAMFAREGARDLAARGWERTPCRVISCSIVKTGDQYGLDLQYQYRYRGQKRQGTRYKRATYSSDSIADADALKRRLQTAEDLHCFVNPNQPDVAILKHTSFWRTVGACGFASIFIVVGLGISLSPWLRRKKGSAVTALAGPSTRSQALGGIYVFCGIFILVGLIIPFFTFVRPLLRWRAARSWQSARAEVTESEVRSHQGDDSTTYSVHVAYRYEFNGETYQNDRYNFASARTGGRAAKAAIVKQHPPGRQITIYVDPHSPQNSVINREWTPGMLLGLIPLVFALFGFIFLVAFTRGRKTRMTSDLNAYAAASGGPLILKPKSGPLGRIIGMVVVTAFWNGVISIFVVQAIREWQRGRQPWGTTLFLVPFVLIGAGLVIALFYQILKAFNPRPRIRLDEATLRLGNQTGFDWDMQGNIYRLRSLAFRLVGKERVTYRRGTNTYHDSSEFFSCELAHLTDPGRMRNGSGRVVVPSTAMHTWKSSNNAIEWSLTVRGEIDRWPDVYEEYTIPVLPMEVTS